MSSSAREWFLLRCLVLSEFLARGGGTRIAFGACFVFFYGFAPLLPGLSEFLGPGWFLPRCLVLSESLAQGGETGNVFGACPPSPSPVE